MILTDMYIERFWEKVNTVSGKTMPGMPTPCWEWSAVKRAGYGKFKLKGEMVSAHRLIYQEVFGAIPEGTEISHLCHNRACVRPSHLIAETHIENVTRSVTADRMSDRRGILNPNRKITEAAAIEIYQSELTHAELAKKFGISDTQVSCIKSGRAWRAVTQAFSAYATSKGK